MEIRVINVPEQLKEQADRKAQRYAELVRRLMELKPSRAFPRPGLAVPRDHWGSRTKRSIYMALSRVFRRKKIRVRIHIGDKVVRIWREEPGTAAPQHPQGRRPIGKHLLEDSDFFRGKSLAELAREQGVGPVKDISVFAGGIPDDEDVDKLVAQLEELRGS